MATVHQEGAVNVVEMGTFIKNTTLKQKVLRIDFQNIIYSVPGPKKGQQIDILKSVSGEFRPGELTAIMGGSGAGKSSLMNILAGFRSKSQGDILINGAPRNLKKFRKMSCYIMQEDKLCPYLSVIEAMQFAANLKMKKKIPSPKKRLLMIDEILESMGLNQAKKTQISNLSGGETKRLAIALELVNNPPVMFFDEPTSGLDSSTCRQVVLLLKSLAQSGRTIICVIHQPSSSIFAMFDQIYLMAEGHCIYCGPRESLVPFLTDSANLVCPSDHNPADFAIEVGVGRFGNFLHSLVDANKTFAPSIKNDNPDESHSSIHQENNTEALCDRYEFKNSATKSDVRDTIETKMVMKPFLDLNRRWSDDESVAGFGDYCNAHFLAQFCLLLKRALQCILKDMTLTYLRLALEIIVALLMSVIYFGIGDEASKALDNISFWFLTHFALMFFGCMSTILTFPTEMPILVREHLNNWYSLKAYFLAKSSIDIPFEVLHVTLYMTIIYLATNQPLDLTRFLMCLAAGILNSLVGQSIGIAMGLAFEIIIAVVIGCSIMAMCVLLGGALIIQRNAPIWINWIFYPAFMKYAFHASLCAVYDFERVNLNCSQPYCMYKSPTAILEEFDVNGLSYWTQIGILTVYFFLVRMASYFLLRRKIRSKY